jgi:hypothetical protein
MSGFSGSPHLIKGALVSLEMFNPLPQVILFQYNPDSMTRSLQGQGGGGNTSPLEAFRLKGPPIETITLEIEMDATDKLEKPQLNPTTVSSGIYPQLSALELLLYPKSQDIISAINATSSGILEIIPPESPLTLFVWGPNRVLPVHLTKCDITEEAFDTNLNPIRAKVSLGLRILSSSDLSPSNSGFSLFVAHQISKEAMAKNGVINDLSSLGITNKSIS